MAQLRPYIDFKLASLGFSPVRGHEDRSNAEILDDLLARHRQHSGLLADYLCPADALIQAFLDRHLADVPLVAQPRLPGGTFVLDRHGLAPELSLPAGGNAFRNELVEVYRIRQGVLHNPRSDRRTTQGVFHVAEVGFPVPADKIGVPLPAYGNLLHHAHGHGPGGRQGRGGSGRGSSADGPPATFH